MAAPITWRTIESNPIGEISRAMSSGQTGINLGFDSFQKILDRQQATDNANWNQEKTNKTNAYMNEVAGVKTPEELAAAEGRLKQMLVDGGAQIDQQAGRQALDARLGQLQGRIESNQKFQQGQQSYTEKDGRDQVATLIAANKPAEAMALATQLGIHDLAPLQKQATETARNVLAQNRTDTQNKQIDAIAALQNPLDLQTKQDDVESNNLLRLAASDHQAYKGEMEKRALDVGKIATSLGLAVDSAGAPKSNYTPEQTTKLEAAMTAAGIKDPKTYLKGDTKRADAYMAGLEQSGKYSPKVLAQHAAAIRAGFDSTGTGSVGIEAQDRKVANAQEDAYIQEISRNTWTTPGSANALQNQSGLTDLVNKNVGEDYRTLAHRAVSKVLTEGIEVKENGKTVKITPSQADIEAAINNTNDEFWNTQGWGGGGGDFGDKLITNLKNRASTSDAGEQRKKMKVIDEYRLRKSSSDHYNKKQEINPINR